jgi:hypothetical protein
MVLRLIKIDVYPLPDLRFFQHSAAPKVGLKLLFSVREVNPLFSLNRDVCISST